ncbi:hypothetical protein [Streptomyces anulatus]|uniref:hypothetical protein n=1 Tax=Streptomyces anulatus TaxID=1892 RepID=UPI0032533C4A
MITDKLERTFDAMDVQDGYLDWSDYQKLADRYIQGYGLSRDDRRTRALQTFCQIYWLELLRHAGRSAGWTSTGTAPSRGTSSSV